jgi:hypothetical protein
MILMSQKIGQGPTQRCDARCYGAKGGNCQCICNGRNHGAGIDKALDNVRTMFAPIVLCAHGKILGTCEHGCTKPTGRVGDVVVTRKALRAMTRHDELKRAEESEASA